MTILFVEGFDWGLNDEDFNTKWTYIHLNFPASTSYGRFGSKGIQPALSLYNQYYVVPDTDTRDELCVGFAFSVQSSGTPSYNAGVPFIKIMDKNLATQVRVHFVGNDLLVYNGAGSLLDTAYGALNRWNWQHIQFRVKVHDTAGEVEIILDGATIVNLTSQDTKYGTAYADGFHIYGVNNGLPTNVDDVWLTDGEFLGDCRVRTFLPDAAGNYSQFNKSGGTYNYEMVDDNPTDEDTTYNQAANLSNKDTFGVTFDIPASTIKTVAITNIAKRTGTKGVSIKDLIRAGGSDYPSTEEHALEESYKGKQSFHATDPSDSNPWTNTKLNNAEFGYIISAITSTSTTTTTTTS